MAHAISVMAMVLAGTAGVAPAADAAVNFAGNEASFAGDCGGEAYGSNNQVSWSSKGEVEITTAGPGNTVTRAR
jgi:hypothetical protein